MNLKSQTLKEGYSVQLAAAINMYVMLNDKRPHESYDKLKAEIQRLGTLVELWSAIESQLKEKQRGN